jgi:L-rhamnose-H+ transport protein
MTAMVSGIALILIAAVLQGVFLLPGLRARGWAWEHVWLVFSLSGMVLCNWLLALLFVSHPMALFGVVPFREIVILACFGLAWGVGAVLFGLAMDAIGLALGYPLIMGLNASVGTFIPLFWFDGLAMFHGRRLLISAGTLVGIAGIWMCSVAGTSRQSSPQGRHDPSRAMFLSGIIMAVVSGVLSCLPNIGLAYGTVTTQAAIRMGSSPAFAGDAVWLIFFTCGGLVNMLYCLWLIVRRRTQRELSLQHHLVNWLWCLTMGVMWIGSFYLYGMGAAGLGQSGATIGWPILVSISIAVGVLCGLGKGEWDGAPAHARSLLWAGLILIVLAVLIIPMGKVSR